MDSQDLTASTDEDLDLIGRSLAGDSDAYGRLVGLYQAHVAGILWRFSRDRAVHEELVQDTFVEVYVHLRGFKARAPFPHWLSRIATRVGYRYWRQMARHRSVGHLTSEQWHLIKGDRTGDLEAGEAADLIHRLFEQLGPRDRLVLTLRFIEELDVAQTALRTGWTQTMVKVQTLRARRRLEKILTQGYEGLP